MILRGRVWNWWFWGKIWPRFWKSMIYSDFERASLKIGDFEAKFDRGFENQWFIVILRGRVWKLVILRQNLTLNLKSLALALKGGPGGTPGKAAGRPGGFRGAEPPYTPKNYFCPPSKEKFAIFGHFELGKVGFWAILGPPDFGNLDILVTLSPLQRILVENTQFLASLALLWPQ